MTNVETPPNPALQTDGRVGRFGPSRPLLNGSIVGQTQHEFATSTRPQDTRRALPE
jgi:hypothetical protein